MVKYLNVHGGIIIPQNIKIEDKEYFLEALDDFANFAEEYEDRYDKSLQIIVFSVNTKDLDTSKISIDSNNSVDEDSQTYFYV